MFSYYFHSRGDFYAQFLLIAICLLFKTISHKIQSFPPTAIDFSKKI